MKVFWTEEELLRFSRHLLLPEVGVAGQEKISEIEALVCARNYSGWVEAAYLAGAGVSSITVPRGDRSWTTDLIAELNPQVKVQEEQVSSPPDESPERASRSVGLGAARAWSTLCEALELNSCSVSDLVPEDPFARGRHVVES